MSLKVKLVRGMSGHTEKHRETLRGLGLTRVGRERVLQDTPAIRGMIEKVAYLIEWSETNEEFKPFGRRSRQQAQKAASEKSAKAEKELR
ncbi:MAG: 50S ribosomal protein L30 [Deltaproteobacteria bacterium 13_1_20CM_2_69_21]|nr:MAG: 50S ribosomal protein L30 [Deltaproteobacteria bacterium 13_1_40CM_4_68_19]OLE64224.1 MAG: 50S ribosomal protein L30 [Deltaproteobacteria bacterium 13_1_20CM_2_69_21]